MRTLQDQLFPRLRARHLGNIFIAGAVQSLAILVIIIFSSNIEWSHFTKVFFPGLGLAVLVLAVHFFGPGLFLKQLQALEQSKERQTDWSKISREVRAAQDELADLPGRLAAWTALWWVVCGVGLVATMGLLPGVIAYWWEMLLAAVVAALGGVFGYLFIFYATRNAVRELAPEILEFDSGFHLERQTQPARGVGRKLMSSFLSINLAGSLILLTLFFFQAGSGERSEKIEVLHKLAAAWENQPEPQPEPPVDPQSPPDDFAFVRKAVQMLGRDFLVFSPAGDLLFSGHDTNISPADDREVRAKLALTPPQTGRDVSVRVDSSREYVLVPVTGPGGRLFLLGQVYSWSAVSGWKTEAFIVCLMFVILTGLLVTQVVRLTARDLLVPVARLLDGTRQVASGDIRESFNIVSDDEIGALAAGMKVMVKNLRGMVDQVRNSYQQLDDVVENLRTSSGSVADSSAEQRGEIVITGGFMGRLKDANREVSAQAGELGDAVSQGVGRIKELMGLATETAGAMEELKHAVDTTSSSILEMSASLKEVAENADQLMGRSEQTSSMVVQMEASIRDVEHSSRDSKAISESVIEHAGAGVEAVQHTISGIGLVRDSVGAALDTIQQLTKSAKRIGKILKVIGDVTNQTNLLALNAAIIAAQAGEHGKGFSVVSDEIKSLADRTASSTAEIDEIIHEVQAGAQAAAAAMREGYQSVEESVNRSFVAGEALEKIQKSVEQSFEMVDRITRSTGEQAVSARRAMEHTEAISELIQQIAYATREQAKGSDLVMRSTQQITLIAGAVKSRTDRQNVAALDVQDVMSGLDQLVDAFNKSHRIENEAGERVQAAMTRIRDMAAGNEQSVSRLDDNIASLKRQAEALASVIARFKIE